MGNAFEKNIELRLERVELRQDRLDREFGFINTTLSKLDAQFYEINKGIRNLRELQKTLLTSVIQGGKND